MTTITREQLIDALREFSTRALTRFTAAVEEGRAKLIHGLCSYCAVGNLLGGNLAETTAANSGRVSWWYELACRPEERSQLADVRTWEAVEAVESWFEGQTAGSRYNATSPETLQILYSACQAVLAERAPREAAVAMRRRVSRVNARGC